MSLLDELTHWLREEIYEEVRRCRYNQVLTELLHHTRRWREYTDPDGCSYDHALLYKSYYHHLVNHPELTLKNINACQLRLIFLSLPPLKNGYQATLAYIRENAWLRVVDYGR